MFYYFHDNSASAGIPLFKIPEIRINFSMKEFFADPKRDTHYLIVCIVTAIAAGVDGFAGKREATKIWESYVREVPLMQHFSVPS